MSHTRAADGVVETPSGVPRVRHLARDAIGLMVFSAIASSTLAGCLLVLTTLGHQG
jgi:hypothetical protein